jgi:hypothetical protein
MPEFIRGFLSYLQVNADVVPQLGKEGFLPNHFQFIISSNITHSWS